MKIQNINTSCNNIYFKSENINDTCNIDKKNNNLGKEYTYSAKDLQCLEQKYKIINTSLLCNDFSIKREDNLASVSVKDNCIQGYIKDKSLTLTMIPGLFKSTEYYSGMLNDKEIKFSCKVKDKGFGEYELKFKNTKDIDKEIIDIVALQKLKKLNTLKYVVRNFNLILPPQN